MDRLPDSHRRVLDLIAEGLSNQQIGRRLGLTEKTVKNYVTLILRALDVPNRTAAALKWEPRPTDPPPPTEVVQLVLAAHAAGVEEGLRQCATDGH